MTTYSRATYQEAQAAWADGDYGWQWQAIRRIAADRGFLYPPSGSAHDDRDAEQPSQRAIVWRALQDNPTATEAIVRRSRSWSQVVDQIIGLELRLRDEAGLTERDAAWGRDDPTHRESVLSLASILGRIEDSR